MSSTRAARALSTIFALFQDKPPVGGGGWIGRLIYKQHSLSICCVSSALSTGDVMPIRKGKCYYLSGLMFKCDSQKENTSQSSECITEKIKCENENIEGCADSIDETAMEGLTR